MREDWSILLHGLTTPEERRVGQELVALAAEALRENRPAVSRFLNEDERRVAHLLFDGHDDLSLRFAGGVRRAQRRRAVLTPRLYFEDLPIPPVIALWVRPAAAADRQGAGALRGWDGDGREGNDAESRGFPDATADAEAQVSEAEVREVLLACGLDADDVGDLYPASEGGWHVLVAGERASEAAGRSGEKIGNRQWLMEPIDLERVDAPPESVKEIRTTVASLRLDAVASAGYAVSRSKMAAEIKAGRVRVNWQVVDQPARAVKAGDVIAIPGRGKVLVEQAGGSSRKGRIILVLKRVR